MKPEQESLWAFHRYLWHYPNSISFVDKLNNLIQNGIVCNCCRKLHAHITISAVFIYIHREFIEEHKTLMHPNSLCLHGVLRTFILITY